MPERLECGGLPVQRCAPAVLGRPERDAYPQAGATEDAGDEGEGRRQLLGERLLGFLRQQRRIHRRCRPLLLACAPL